MMRILLTLSTTLVALALCGGVHATDAIAGGNGAAMKSSVAGNIDGNTIISTTFPPGRITLD